MDPMEGVEGFYSETSSPSSSPTPTEDQVVKKCSNGFGSTASNQPTGASAQRSFHIRSRSETTTHGQRNSENRDFYNPIYSWPVDRNGLSFFIQKANGGQPRIKDIYRCYWAEEVRWMRFLSWALWIRVIWFNTIPKTTLAGGVFTSLWRERSRRNQAMWKMIVL